MDRKKRCFIAIPFGDSGDPVQKRSRLVVNRIIKPPLLKLDYVAKPVSQKIGSITQTVLTEIANCDLFIADLTDSNPNVFYELAFAHAICKPTIPLIMRSQRKKLPFDVKDQNTVAYDYIPQRDGDGLSKVAETQKRIKQLARGVLKKIYVHGSPISHLLSTENTLDLLVQSLSWIEAIKYSLSTLNELLRSNEKAQEDLKALKMHEPEFHRTHDEICRFLYGSPRSRLINDFVQYCRECKLMVNRSSNDGIGILTVQTPIDIDMDESFKKAYDDYISASINRILSSRIRYRRLVVIRHNPELAYKRVMKFLRKLIRRGLKAERKTLDNVWIGFVKLESALDSLCSNVDFHITSEREFSLSFVSSKLKRQFGESLHVLDAEKYVSERIRTNVYKMWSDTNVKKIQLSRKYYSSKKSYTYMMDTLDNFVKRIIGEMSEVD